MPTLNNLNVVFIRDRDGNFTPVNGFMGSPGRGIVSIERTSGDGTSGSIDVYTITYTDKTTSTFEVYNGSDGESGATPEQIAAAIEQYLSENPFVKKETDPTVFRWAKAELFDKNDLVDPAGRNSFVTIDDIEYYRYNASAQNFEWNNPNPQTGSVAITARGVSQYGGTGSTRLRTFFDDGTEGEPLFIIVNGESRTVTYTTPSDKVLAKITGNYDMENWVLLDMSVMSCMADYPAPKGTVKTVNGISPDGNGNIQFDAADVNAVAQNQGAENAGKFLSINESGEVIPVESGADGITPHIGENGNWYIGDTDTGVKAQGEKGADGTTPHIGDNGDWYIGETDTGIKAQGEKGDPGSDGITPHIGANGNWWIGDTDTGVKAVASGGSGTDIALGITGAAVGQIARITAVDDAGIPTAWEPVDMASGGVELYGNREPDYYYEVAEEISQLYISEINGNPFSANKFACLVEFPAGTGGFYYHALYTVKGSTDKNYCISNHNAPKLSYISTKDSVVFFIVEKLNNQNYKYNYSGQCKTREQKLDGSSGTYAAGIFPNSIEGETSIKSIFLKGENAFGVGVKISIWLD